VRRERAMTTLATKDGLITQSASVPALVAAIYKTASGQSISHNIPTVVDFNIRELDTHNAVTTGANWRFTAPVGGLYVVHVAVLFTSTTAWSDGEIGALILNRNGSDIAVLNRKDNYGSATSLHMQLSGSTALYLAAGDYIDIRVYQTSGVTLSFYTDSLFNRVSIHRVPG
jgi:hypothetical protein